MTDPDLLIRRLRDAANPSNPERDLLQEAADTLDDLQACKSAAERALGATASTAEEAVSLLATEHLNLKRRMADRARVAAEDAALGVGNRRGGRFDPEPVDAYKERIRAMHGLQAKPAPGTIEVAGGDGETIRALGLPEAKPLVSIVLPALRFEDKRITSSNTLSVLCGEREVWTGNGTCELDIRTTVVENQISYAHPLTFDCMMEAKGTIWLQANDEAAALLRTYRNGSIGLVLCFPADKSLFTALLFDIADGEKPPTSEPGWLGFTVALETP